MREHWAVLADNPALALFKKFDQYAQLRALWQLSCNLPFRLVQCQPGFVQGLVSALDAGYGIGCERAPLQPFGIDAVRLGDVSGSSDIGGNILSHNASGAQHAVGANMAKLM